MREETGWPQADVQILGLFHEAPSITQVAVTPVLSYIGEVNDLQKFSPSEHEIAQIFTVPISELSDGEMWKIDEFGVRGKLPRFISKGLPDIWGLTGYLTYRIVDELVCPINPPCNYSFSK